MAAALNRKKVVIGGNYRDYRLWLIDNKLSERDAFYVGHAEEKLMGLELKEEDIVRLGPVSYRLAQYLRTRIR